MSGQTLTDRLAAAQYSLTGSEVSRAVCKATTHEQTPPKKKHMECKLPINQKKIYKSVYLSRGSILLSIHPPSYSSTTRPCATTMMVVASSIHPSNGFYYVHGGLPLPLYVFPYIPTKPACLLYCVRQPGHSIEPEGSHRAR